MRHRFSWVGEWPDAVWCTSSLYTFDLRWETRAGTQPNTSYYTLLTHFTCHFILFVTSSHYHETMIHLLQKYSAQWTVHFSNAWPGSHNHTYVYYDWWQDEPRSKSFSIRMYRLIDLPAYVMLSYHTVHILELIALNQISYSRSFPRGISPYLQMKGHS